MRRTSALLLTLSLGLIGTFAVGCDNDDDHRYDDRTHYRADRISRDWDRTRDHFDDRRWDEHRDWDRDNDNLRRNHDHRGEGLMDRDQNRNEWDRR